MLVSEPIFEGICEAGVDPVQVLRTFETLLERYGPFDAHHEPMTNFLFKRDLTPEIPKLLLLPLQHLKDGLSRFLEESDVRTSASMVSSNVRSPRPDLTNRDFQRQRLRRHIRALRHTVLRGRDHEERLPSSHPIALVAGNTYVGEFQAQEAVRVIYDKILNSPEAVEIAREVVDRHYQPDLRLWEAVVTSQSPSAGVNVSPLPSQADIFRP